MSGFKPNWADLAEMDDAFFFGTKNTQENSTNDCERAVQAWLEDAWLEDEEWTTVSKKSKSKPIPKPTPTTSEMVVNPKTLSKKVEEAPPNSWAKICTKKPVPTIMTVPKATYVQPIKACPKQKGADQNYPQPTYKWEMKEHDILKCTFCGDCFEFTMKEQHKYKQLNWAKPKLCYDCKGQRYEARMGDD